MVVQERCRTIVMLCSDVDECKDKYTTYYPTCVGDTITVGKTMVTSITQFISGKLGYTVSIFEVQHA
ncbi:hypothetical protein TELCIR_08189 [Teladorsagia circumcincta]|uniref:Tyrosine-protein phosphatase domain-containing protein n=1 Tax=Teladorsagia circumcincta TaxID=45464 RepID=A0A2G9UI97_TELCI|nr:hypothetical protein TELCIR_08189 [Teladorsagia circumcincta]